MAEYVPRPLQYTVPLVRMRRQHVHDGASRHEIIRQALNSWATRYEDGNESCPVCFENFATTKADDGKENRHTSSRLFNGRPEFPVLTPCMHKFGSLCLARWLLASDSCPLCRRELIYDGSVHTDNSRNVQRSLSLTTHPHLSNPLWETSSTPQRGIRDMTNAAQRPSSRSLSFSGTRDISTFEQQRWNARMGGLGHANPFYGDIGNVLAAGSDGRPARVRLPNTTTTHGHPVITPVTSFIPSNGISMNGWVRRQYEGANIATYELRPQINNAQPSYPTGESNNPSWNERWRHWDYVSGSHRASYAARNASRNPHSMNNATGVGMPRERTIPSRWDTASSARAEPTDDSFLARAMEHDLSLGTVVGTPRGEQRWSARSYPPRRPGTSTETPVDGMDRASRGSETSSIEDDLSGLPRLGSSMWAH
ncbi:hypothetical protein DSL72_003858 [Monilinia vaccinii-corymbosi]|uniref:RING-type domain-containing protein n=1 Tax=Monilinia vaccinii-corymbosi TaxID=61207 RepID=A0A8A3P0Q8_9HELO|nr:hypothetical protein DSL72_003858 [Monilinia vaccinii-corymbosi]